jgi:hypothetical protein
MEGNIYLSLIRLYYIETYILHLEILFTIMQEETMERHRLKKHKISPSMTTVEHLLSIIKNITNDP